MTGQLAMVSSDCATLLAVELPAHLASHHGVCILHQDALDPNPRYYEVEDILYQEPLSVLHEKGALIEKEETSCCFVYTGMK